MKLLSILCFGCDPPDSVLRAGARPLAIAADVNRGNLSAKRLAVESSVVLDDVLSLAWTKEGYPL